MVWYFAYGSNMSAARLIDERLGPRGVPVTARVGGRLDDWRLSFNKLRNDGSGAGNILSAKGHSVFGTLNEMPEAGLDVLDAYEGVRTAQYRRKILEVARTDGGGTVEAVTYIALRLGADDLRPTRAYLGYLMGGRDLLPSDYCSLLERQLCVD